MHATTAQLDYLDRLAKQLDRGDGYALLAEHLDCTRAEAQRQDGPATIAAASKCIDAAKSEIEARDRASKAAAPVQTVRVIVPATGNDLRKPSSSKGYGRWRWAGGSWSSARYEGPALAAEIEIQTSLRRASGKVDVSSKRVPVAPGRYEHGSPQPYEIEIQEIS